MKNIIGGVWPVLLADAVIYVIQELISSPATEGTKALPNTVFEIVGFGLVAAVAFIAARRTGHLKTAVIATLLFWFIWRPLLFLLGLPIGIFFQALSADQAMKATLGLVIALLLFSPLALVLGVVGGVLGRRMAKP